MSVEPLHDVVTGEIIEARRHREYVPMAAHLSLIFRAWNARCEGRTVHRLQVTNKGGDIVVPEPA